MTFKLLSYAYFTSQADFETWQKENKYVIQSVSPYTFGANLEGQEDDGRHFSWRKESTGKIDYQLGIFVVYDKEERFDANSC